MHYRDNLPGGQNWTPIGGQGCKLFDSVTRGVERQGLDLESAYQACESVAIDTDNPRLMYQFGRVLDERGDHETAAVWFMSAADKDYPAAYVGLAVLYADGDGVRKDHSKALEWLEKAARQHDDPSAQVRLGRVYRDRLLGTKDPRQAHRWFQKAAEQGHPEAQLALGRLYEQGVGVRLDSARAKHWYEKAAAQGFVEAEERLQELSGG